MTGLPRTVVVVPTYNERENVGPLIDELLAQGPQIDVWIADDGSPDGTGDAVRAKAAAHPGRVELVDRRQKGGRGAAVLASFIVVSLVWMGDVTESWNEGMLLVMAIWLIVSSTTAGLLLASTARNWREEATT